MLECLTTLDPMLAASSLSGMLKSSWNFLLAFLGFSIVIFVHELGHFVMAKLAGVRVDKFAIGFGREIVGFTRGETRYALNVLPLGGYVKMLGQEDFTVDKSGEILVKEDPRSFTNKPVGWRMAIVSAGVVMNILFAVFLFMIVFMIGFEVLGPAIGTPLPGTPAEQAGLEFGDRILEINGKAIDNYSDIQMAVVLAEQHSPLKIRLERKGQILEKEIRPENSPDKNVLQIGVPPMSTRVISYVDPEPAPGQEDAPRAGDEVLSVNGRPVNDFLDVQWAALAAQGRPLTLEVQRADPKSPEKKIARTVTRQSHVVFLPPVSDFTAPKQLLGFMPRTCIVSIQPDSPAQAQGFEAHDIVVEWANITAPTVNEIKDSIESSDNGSIGVVVSRKGQRLNKQVRPQRTGYWAKGKPQVGFGMESIGIGEPIVATIVEEADGRPTAAAPLRKQIPRGSRITRVNDTVISTWNELVLSFMANAGQEVKISWQRGGEAEQTAALKIPGSIHGEGAGHIPPMAAIVEIDGQSSAEIAKPDGTVLKYPLQALPRTVDEWAARGAWRAWKGTHELLMKHYKDAPDKPVVIRYRDIRNPGGPIEEARITLTADTLDPWTMLIMYVPGLAGTPVTHTLQTNNPIKALQLGLNKMYDVILQAYLTMQRMVFDRTVGVENISGPVGIFNAAMQFAEMGATPLLFFLAFLSANLAVLNFLPLPIVDGGHMVFLIVEKIRGTPVSVKIQVVTQVVGLVLIVTVFVFVLFMDCRKML